jgi:hypothetical protein
MVSDSAPVSDSESARPRAEDSEDSEPLARPRLGEGTPGCRRRTPGDD